MKRGFTLPPGIDPLACIGRPPEHRDAMHSGIPPHIDESARIEAFCTVDAGVHSSTFVGPGCWAMKGCHIGHDAVLKADVELAPHCSVGGHVFIGKGVRVGQGATFKPFVQIGDGARIGMGAVVVKDVPAGETWVGNPARKLK